MSFVVVPGAFLIVLLLLSSVGTSTEKYEKAPKKPSRTTQVAISKPIGMLEQKHTDLDTIFNYITKKFKKVSNDDARHIARNLVDYGKKHNVDPKFAAAVIARESAFKKDAVSVTGAKGLGQIKDFNYKMLDINDPFNINQNVDGTIHYLKKMIKKWKENTDEIVVAKAGNQRSNEKIPVSEKDHLKLALASYYKGFTAVKTTGLDPKTEKYVEDILKYYHEIASSESK